MTGTDRMTERLNVSAPWSVAIAVLQIPQTGLQRDIAASADECTAIAGLGQLPAVSAAQASLLLMPLGNGHVRVTGRVWGRLTQTCVVTLDPIESDFDETIDQLFAPPAQIRELADLVDDDAESDADTPDPPEPIDNGFIDLGRLATDALFLGLDPYPRTPGAVFQPPDAAPDPEDHPFAGLRALKTDRKPAVAEKPKP